MSFLAEVASAVTGPVLFFDGACGLCQRIVRLLLRLDRRALLRFAPLQGNHAQAYLARHGLPTQDFNSLIFVPAWSRREQPDYLQRTDGAMAALRTCGGFGVVLGNGLRIFPRAWRDAAYRVIARWRYRIFGAARPLPLKPDWAARFLD